MASSARWPFRPPRLAAAGVLLSILIALAIELCVVLPVAADAVLLPPRPMDRKFPVDTFCPWEFMIHFVPDTTVVTLHFAANTRASDGWTGIAIDNIAIARRTPDNGYEFDSFVGSCPACPAYVSGAVTGYLFDQAFIAGVEGPRFLARFDVDPTPRGWDLSSGAYWDPTFTAPDEPSSNSSANYSGCLRLGSLDDAGPCGRDTARTSVTVTLPLLNPGDEYVLSGWWYSENITENNTTMIVSITTPKAPLTTAVLTQRPYPVGEDAFTTVASFPGGQETPAVVPDGAGGAIVVWDDEEPGIYARRVDANGAPLWPASRVLLAPTPGWSDPSEPVTIPDGLGGAIVAWTKEGNGSDLQIQAQRISASGALLWGPDGIPVCAAAGTQEGPGIATDGAGGAFIAWRDARSPDGGTYAQHLNASGAASWAVNGIRVGPQSWTERTVRIASDGSTGAIVAWHQELGGDDQVYAQRLTSTGTLAWGAAGVRVSPSGSDQTEVRLSVDGSGNSFLGWRQLGTSRVRKLLPDGTPVWPTTAVEGAGGGAPVVVADGAGGAYVAGSNTNSIDAQHLDASGVPTWPIAGVPVGVGGGTSTRIQLGLDSIAGGLSVVWADGDQDVRVQSIGATGQLRWHPDGVRLDNNGTRPVFLADGTGGLLVFWDDASSAGAGDIVMHRVTAQGILRNPEPWVSAITDVVADQGGKVRIDWQASHLDGNDDLAHPYRVTEYRVWRGTPAVLVGVKPAAHALSYNMEVPTGGDAIAGIPPIPETFRVEAVAAQGGLGFDSPTASGYSIDNRAPVAPGPIVAATAGPGTLLSWSSNPEADVVEYRIHRDTVSWFLPDPSNFVAATPETSHVDVGRTGEFYRVQAVDSHGNPGPFAYAHECGAVVEVSLPRAPLALGWARVAPNPSRESVTFNVGLPRAANAELGIFDLSGRRIRSLVSRELEAGVHPVVWDLRDTDSRRVSSGVFFARFACSGQVFRQTVVVLDP